MLQELMGLDRIPAAVVEWLVSGRWLVRCVVSSGGLCGVVAVLTEPTGCVQGVKAAR